MADSHQDLLLRLPRFPLGFVRSFRERADCNGSTKSDDTLDYDVRTMGDYVFSAPLNVNLTAISSS
jgi:hypothetical protein